METLLEIIKITIPAVVVLLTTYFLVGKFLDRENNLKAMELRHAHKETITPIRLQAHERIILFLERINPNSVIMRANKNTSAMMLERELINIVRSEYEHNLSQQLYISTKAWDATVNAKEETIKLISVAASKVHREASALELAQTIIAITAQLTELPTTNAIALVKKEIRKLF
jgi:hypothetical protein